MCLQYTTELSPDTPQVWASEQNSFVSHGSTVLLTKPELQNHQYNNIVFKLCIQLTL